MLASWPDGGASSFHLYPAKSQQAVPYQYTPEGLTRVGSLLIHFFFLKKVLLQYKK